MDGWMNQDGDPSVHSDPPLSVEMAAPKASRSPGCRCAGGSPPAGTLPEIDNFQPRRTSRGQPLRSLDANRSAWNRRPSPGCLSASRPEFASDAPSPRETCSQCTRRRTLLYFSFSPLGPCESFVNLASLLPDAAGAGWQTVWGGASNRGGRSVREAAPKAVLGASHSPVTSWRRWASPRQPQRNVSFKLSTSKVAGWQTRKTRNGPAGWAWEETELKRPREQSRGCGSPDTARPTWTMSLLISPGTMYSTCPLAATSRRLLGAIHQWSGAAAPHAP